MIVYLSSPYTKGDVAANVAVQMDAAHQIMDAGHTPITPLLSHFLHLHRQRPYEDWMRIDLELVPLADVVLRLPGESTGADQEVARATDKGIPVVYSWHELWELAQGYGRMFRTFYEVDHRRDQT